MQTNLKHIHIGKLIAIRMQECGIEISRAAAFLKVGEEEIEEMYSKKSLDCDTLLRWSKLLKYDFFRLYSQHLILYSPQETNNTKNKEQSQQAKTSLPVFKKNVYTQEVILYLIELVESGRKTCRQIQEEYNIPSTTVFRWRDKYGKAKITKE